MDDSYQAILADAERTLDDVDRALARLDEATYATCEMCGAAVGEDRLDELPTTRRCADHLPLTEGPVTV